jgi:hypothetical protein
MPEAPTTQQRIETRAPLPVIGKAEALTAPTGDATAPDKWYRFVKNMNPNESTIPGVEFRQVVDRKGYKKAHGTFQTRDAAIAAKLRAFAKDHPTQYIFEQ